MPIDYKKYPKNWLSEIRPRIMKRAKNTCEFDGCDFKHGETVFSVKNKGKVIGWFRDFKEADSHPKTIESNKKGLIQNPKPVKVVLTIAHLDHDETNMDIKDERLKAGCQLCHLRYDAKEKYKRALNKSSKMEHRNTIVTIDPGSNGSIVIFDQGKIHSVKMPLKYNAEGKKPKLDVQRMFQYFSEAKEKYSNIFIFIEKVQSFGSDSSEGGKSFGILKMLKNYYQLLTIIEIQGFRFVEVPPITWQTTLYLKIKKPEGMKIGDFKTMRKNLYKDYAVKHFPGTPVTLYNSDALCLVQFAFVKMSEDIEWIRSRIQGGKSIQTEINLK